ncbi:hypothetical protein QA811_41805 [Streptomyces sp. B21-102]
MIASVVGAGGSNVELYAALRRDSRDGMSNRALQCKYGVTWSRSRP